MCTVERALLIFREITAEGKCSWRWKLFCDDRGLIDSFYAWVHLHASLTGGRHPTHNSDSVNTTWGFSTLGAFLLRVPPFCCHLEAHANHVASCRPLLPHIWQIILRRAKVHAQIFFFGPPQVLKQRSWMPTRVYIQRRLFATFYQLKKKIKPPAH